MINIIILLFIACIAWLWLSSIRAKEIAMQASASACKEIEAQFLDQTASLKSMRLIRNAQGRLSIERTYTFDFSRDRETRAQGYVIIKGHRVSQIALDDDSGATIL